MKKARLLRSFPYSDPAFETKTQVILASMTGNVNFKNPTPSIPELLDSLNTYTEALAAAGSGDRTRIAAKNKARKALEAMLLDLADYVTLIAKGDREILLSSGFDLQKDGKSKRTLTAPAAFEVTAGKNPGEIAVKLAGSKNVSMYRHEYVQGAATDTSVWNVFTSTRQKYLHRGLKSGIHSFRSAAGLGEDLVYSNVVTYLVQ